jgi:hypothetical protein
MAGPPQAGRPQVLDRNTAREARSERSQTPEYDHLRAMAIEAAPRGGSAAPLGALDPLKVEAKWPLRLSQPDDIKGCFYVYKNSCMLVTDTNILYQTFLKDHFFNPTSLLKKIIGRKRLRFYMGS